MYRFPFPALPVYKSARIKAINEENRKIDSKFHSRNKIKSENNSKFPKQDKIDEYEKPSVREVRPKTFVGTNFVMSDIRFFVKITSSKSV